MTVSDAIKAVKVMLGADVPTEEIKLPAQKEEVAMGEAELVDGTIVYSEGDLAVGSTLYVKTPEGEEDVLAPLGKHETTSGLIVSVGEGGLIEAIDEVEAAPVEAPVTTNTSATTQVAVWTNTATVYDVVKFVVKVKDTTATEIEALEETKVKEEQKEDIKEEEMEEHDLPKEEEMNAENLLVAIADMIKGYMVEVSEVKEELSQLTERFNEVADMPATKPVKKSFMQQASAANEVANARMDYLTSLRRKTLTK